MEMKPRSRDIWVAVGVVSAPSHIRHRTVLRSWLSLPDSDAATLSLFAVRSGGAPQRVSESLIAEQREHEDMLLLPTVAWDETRLRGTVLTLAAWLEHAATHLRARFVAKVDDDLYLHAPRLASMLRALRPLGDHSYLGALAWHGWRPALWDACGFGWTATLSSSNLKREGCDKAQAEVAGPFPFAIGYLVVLSAPLVAAAVASPAYAAELARLRAFRPARRELGINEDVWLGSFLHRHLHSLPIAFVDLSSFEGIVDLGRGRRRAPDLMIPRSAVAVHVKSKEVGAFLAVHDLFTQRNGSAERCQPRQPHLSCGTGCPKISVNAYTISSDLGRIAAAEITPSSCHPEGSANGNASSVFCRVWLEPGGRPAYRVALQRFVQCGRGAGCKEPSRWASPAERHRVRCCSDSPLPGWPVRAGCSVWAESDGPLLGGCHLDKTFEEAASICRGAGARLCSADELRGGCARGTGCHGDRHLAWSGDRFPAADPPLQLPPCSVASVAPVDLAPLVRTDAMLQRVLGMFPDRGAGWGPAPAQTERPAHYVYHDASLVLKSPWSS